MTIHGFRRGGRCRRGAGALGLAGLAAAIMLGAAGNAHGQTADQSQIAAAIPWSDRVIPLPKQMRVTDARETTAGAVALDLPAWPAAAPEALTIRRLLAGWAQGQPGQAAVMLHLQLADARTPASEQVDFLRAAPNPDQAYAIWHAAPGADGCVHLHAMANTPLGLLYAARTLTQLVKPPDTAVAATPLVVPLPTIHDWPDLAGRGEAMTDVDFAWMARWKMNLHESQLGPALDEQGAPYFNGAAAASNVILAAAAEGVKEVPYLYHLAVLARQLWKFQGNTNFPQLQTVIRTPDPGQTLNPYLNFRGVYGLCMSSPATRELLTGWMLAMAELVKDHHRELEVWLSEEPMACHCEKCRGHNQYVLETQAILAAFGEVRKKYPGVKLIIGTSQGSYREAEQNQLVLDLLPPEIGIWYYNGTLTYRTSYEPLIYPLLEQAARAGRFLSVVPQITSNMRIIVPWTAPQFLQMRCREFVDKKLSAVSAFVVPDERWHAFNVIALAEWSWNAHGRSPAEFARAYATVTGICDPVLFAEWAVLAGETGMELAESDFIARMRSTPAHMGLGFRDKPFGAARLADAGLRGEMLDRARRAEALAAQAQAPAMVCESRFTRAQLEAFDSLWNMADLLDAQALGADAQGVLARELNRLDASAQRARFSLAEWGALHAPPAEWHERLTKTIPVLLRTCDAAWDRAVKLGLTDPRPASRTQPLGGWTLSDFLTNNPVFRFDITDRVATNGGAYHAVFSITNGFAPWVHTVTVYAVQSGDAATSVLARVAQQRVAAGTPRFLFEETRLTLPPVPAGSRVILEAPMELDSRVKAAIMKNPAASVCAGAIGWRRVYGPAEWDTQGLTLP